MKKFNHGLIVGRFQPFHKGHIRLINKMVEDCSMGTIIIGSSQEYGTVRNPFRFRERKDMIKSWLVENKLDKKIKIIAQIDTDDYYGWSKTVLDNISDHYEDEVKVDALYCGLNYDSQFYLNEIENIIIVDRRDNKYPHNSGTLIRELCTFQDERWIDLVPKESVPFLKTLMKKYYYDGLAK